jgi:hypothetical protein
VARAVAAEWSAANVIRGATAAPADGNASLPSSASPIRGVAYNMRSTYSEPRPGMAWPPEAPTKAAESVQVGNSQEEEYDAHRSAAGIRGG